MKKLPTLKKSPVASTSIATSKKETAASKPEKTTKATKESKPKIVKDNSENPKPIDNACELALVKLRDLNIDENLQGEIAWCLGSYRNDNNASGLYLAAKRALAIFTVELASKTKGVTTKLVSDLEKAIGGN